MNLRRRDSDAAPCAPGSPEAGDDREMRFELTPDAMRARTKTVTRRRGWCHLKVGDRREAVGYFAGGRESFGVIEFVSVRREPLCDLSLADVAAEGFPQLDRLAFVLLLVRNLGIEFDEPLTRLEFRWVDERRDVR